jgi:hypothetical protein
MDSLWPGRRAWETSAAKASSWRLKMSVEFWRNLAIVWLALFCFIGLLLPLAAALFAVKGMHYAVAKTPGLLHQAQEVTRQGRLKVDGASRTAADQVIRARSKLAGVETRLSRLAGSGSHPNQEKV